MTAFQSGTRIPWNQGRIVGPKPPLSVRLRTTIVQQKTGRPVPFEQIDPTRDAPSAWLSSRVCALAIGCPEPQPAVEALTRYMAIEIGPRGITVDTVAPGAIATDFSGGATRDNPEVNKAMSSGTALGRVGGPDDVGPVIAALLSDEFKFVTGQRFEVSGGLRL